jgi:parvulin-like peptidyl-prolyl isomerase
MHIIAKVFDSSILESELLQECKRFIPADQTPDLDTRKNALSRLIDRLLLIHYAIVNGYSAEESEFDAALMEILDKDETAQINPEMAKDRAANELEKLIRNKIILRKFLADICNKEVSITDEKLREFYDEQKEVFFSTEEVRASHILIKGDDEATLARITDLRAHIHSPEQFTEVCSNSSECPSCYKCGDLGYFSRGKLLKEIEDVAFSLEINEISKPFNTKHGYHLLMVTDKRNTSTVSFDDIKDSLRARLVMLEREYLIVKKVKELRNSYSEQIVIVDPAYV